MSPPSIKEATHKATKWPGGDYYKVGEDTVYIWIPLRKGWATSGYEPWDFDKSDEIQEGYWETKEGKEVLARYHHTTPQSTSDCEAVHRVLGAYEQYLWDTKPHVGPQVTMPSKDVRLTQLKEERDTLKSKNSNLNTEAALASATEMCNRWDKRLEEAIPLTPSMTEKNDNPRSTTCANNRQVGGDHYKKMKVQPWEIYDSIFNKDEQVGFYLGNVLKYLFRYKNKSGLQDLEKAKHYLEKLIETVRSNQ